MADDAVDVPPAGGWGSLKAVAGILLREQVVPAAMNALRVQNKPGGFACVSCAWAKPAHPHPAEFCENGAKATAWELTSKRVTSDFFAANTLASLERCSDLELEAGGRLTAPMRWDAATDTYREVGWDQAFAEIGAELRAIAPDSVAFYTSGRASLETSFLWQLFARAYGSQNLPDSSNMCHESTSVALPKTLGVPIGTVELGDFDRADAIFFFGQNVGVSSPRLLHELRSARHRGVPIVTFNPIRESGLVAFDSPQSPVDMLTPGSTAISTQYLQVRPGGDIAAIAGMCKHLVEADDDAVASGRTRVLDAGFIAEHCHGFHAFARQVREADWSDIERESGLGREALQQAATTYAGANRVIAVYGMGLTQHARGVLNVQMLVDLLLLRGNVGKPGAGICPVRGHSNVQGQRTVGISEKPELVPLDRLRDRYGFEPPRHKGRATVEVCEGVLDGSIRAFLGLGGNFVRAVPDTDRIEAAWRKLRLTVQVATRLNRSHVMHGEVAYLLPCLGRIEIDRQASGVQVVTTEDSTGFMQTSHGVAEPASTLLRSEPAIVCAMAEHTLGTGNARLRWRDWSADYALVRDEIAAVWPDIFHDFNDKLDTAGGFPRPIAARHRVWNTATEKANFTTFDTLSAIGDVAGRSEREPGVMRLMTLRSDDQFNTTVYSLDDRFRRIVGTRRVLLMHRDDIADLGFAPGDRVAAETVWDDGIERRVADLALVAYDIPRGAVGGYYPELNPLIPLAYHALESHVPAAKAVPIRLRR